MRMKKRKIIHLFKKSKGKEKAEIKAKKKLSTKFKDIISEVKNENQKPIKDLKRRKKKY